MRLGMRSVAAVLAIVTAVPAFAGNVDDAIRLASSGVSDEVMLAWASTQGGEAICAADIIRMRDAKVSEKTIVTLIRLQNRVEVAEQAPAPREAVRYAAPVARERASYVRESDTAYATPAVTYVEPAVSYVQPAYYSSYYPYSYYGGGYYPYYGSSLSLSFGSRYGHGYYGGGYRYGSGYYGGHYGGGYSSGGHYGGSYGGHSGGHGYSGGTGYRSR